MSGTMRACSSAMNALPAVMASISRRRAARSKPASQAA